MPLPFGDATLGALDLDPARGQLGLQRFQHGRADAVRPGREVRRGVGRDGGVVFGIGQPAEAVPRERLPPSQLRRPQALGRFTQTLVSEIQEDAVAVGQRRLVRAPGGIVVTGPRRRDPHQELQGVPRERQAQLGRQRPLPQPALDDAAAAQETLDAPAAPPRQQERAALGQGVLHQPHGRPAETGRRRSPILHKGQSGLGRLPSQEVVQQPQQVRLESRNRLHGLDEAPALIGIPSLILSSWGSRRNPFVGSPTGRERKADHEPCPLPYGRGPDKSLSRMKKNLRGPFAEMREVPT